jgi:hypothetical protein
VLPQAQPPVASSIAPSTRSLTRTQSLPPPPPAIVSRRRNRAPSHASATSSLAAQSPSLATAHQFRALSIAQCPLPRRRSKALPISTAPVEITLNPPHSLASDAWKGLVFSLMAANRNAEALMASSTRFPPTAPPARSRHRMGAGHRQPLRCCRRRAPRQRLFPARRNFYLLHRVAVPPRLKFSTPGCSTTSSSDAALYPVMQRLDARTDLSDQRNACNRRALGQLGHPPRQSGSRCGPALSRRRES